VTTPSGGLVGDAVIRVTADTDPAIRAITSFASSAGSSFRGLALPIAGIGAALGAVTPAVADVAAAVASIAPAAAAAATGFVAI